MTSSTKPELYNVSYIALTEEDRATAIGNMHRNLVKTGNDRGQTDRCVVPLIHSTVPPAESVINTNGTDQYTVNYIEQATTRLTAFVRLELGLGLGSVAATYRLSMTDRAHRVHRCNWLINYT